MFKNLQNKQFKIVEKFKIFIVVSLVVILAGVGMLFAKGMNVGIDFSGGAQISIELSSFGGDKAVQEVIDKEITKIFEDNGMKKVGALQTSPTTGGGYTYEFRLAYYHNGELSGVEAEQEFLAFIQGDLSDDSNNGLCGVIQEKLEELSKSDSAFTSLSATIDENCVKGQTIGATASSSLLRNAGLALLIAVVAMLIYIVFRFKFTSALAAICALLHDVLIMTALTIIFQIPVNSTFIAAIITIVGYSINATIVIFDRIREERKMDVSNSRDNVEIANTSIAKTLGRSILTTLTTLLTILFIAFFSVSSINEFIIPIIFGLVAGVYSSVFLASSFWVMFEKAFGKKKAKKTK